MPNQVKNKQTILIVEDEQIILEMYKDKFKSAGFRVVTAVDGKKALTRIKEGADLILLDILMPGLNGFEVLKKLRAQATTKDIPVIVLTNMGDTKSNQDRNLALSLGAQDYIIKSLSTPEEVAERVRALLKK